MLRASNPRSANASNVLWSSLWKWHLGSMVSSLGLLLLGSGLSKLLILSLSKPMVQVDERCGNLLSVVQIIAINIEIHPVNNKYMTRSQGLVDFNAVGLSRQVLDSSDLDDGVLDLVVTSKLHQASKVLPELLHETVVAGPANRCGSQSISIEVRKPSLQVRVARVCLLVVESDLDTPHDEIITRVVLLNIVVGEDLKPGDEIAK